ncbi:hypothetical protein SEPCBS119000_002960 [Sporothrix epigloea]|uniref:Uncharacterized protein n=1 Tax=Sporothrix epigloea TaxID=1892477 RepID=A0ABP0DKU8_9PEZI
MFKDLQARIRKLCERQGIKVIGPPEPVATSETSDFSDHDVGAHWVEGIFSRPPTARTRLKQIPPSKCYGPWCDFNPNDVNVLFRRSFERGLIVLSAFIDPTNRSSFLVIRSLETGAKRFSVRGIHDLCIERDGSSLVIKRSSPANRSGKLWAVLSFRSWEDLVLFHCTFVSLKFESELTRKVDRSDCTISDEKRHYQATIIDDGFQHSLQVLQDNNTRGLRLNANVWDGPLRYCPVWTAFITQQVLCPYVFCAVYREANMRQNKHHAFEMEFLTEEARESFLDIFEMSPVHAAGSKPTATEPVSILKNAKAS